MTRLRRARPSLWAVALGGGLLAVMLGGVRPDAAAGVLARAAPILLFLVAVTVLAELSDVAGVFQAAGGIAVRAGQGRTLQLFLLVIALATVTTVFLSLDTTAVLLTPVVLAMCANLDLDPVPFAMATVWLANTTSLLLPVSNLTNLLAVSRLHLSSVAFAERMWLPTLATLCASVAALLVIHRRRLGGRYATRPAAFASDRLLLVICSTACAGFAALVLGGVNVTVAASAGAVVAGAAALVRRPAALRWSLVPWRLVALVVGLFLLVAAGQQHGLDSLLARVSGTAGDSLVEQLRVSAVAAAAANGVNNLPAYLALEPVSQSSAPGLFAVLIGVNAGPLVLPWGSLATLLWRDRCKARGVQISWRGFIATGLVLSPISVWLGVLALHLTRP